MAARPTPRRRRRSKALIVRPSRAIAMPANQRVRLKQWLESGEAQLHPLAFPQRELWETSPVPVEDDANHICCIIEVQGLLTEADCRAAIQRVVDRQEVLRLSILPGKERPLQMIRKNFGINFDFREVATAEARPGAIEESAAEIFREPFDLVQGPLYRVVNLCRAPNEHVLVFAIHHAIADGWSLGVLVEDLFAAYIGEMVGSSRALPPVRQTYTAWDTIERASWRPPELEQRVDFWKTSLADTRRVWSVPITPGPPERWLSQISANLTNETRELARRTGVTLFNALLGAFQIAFCEWSGYQDLTVGTPVANRSKQNSRETMGYYAGHRTVARPARSHLRGGRSPAHRASSNDRRVCQRHSFCRIGPRFGREIGGRIQPAFRSTICFAKPSRSRRFVAESFCAFEHAFDRHRAVSAWLRNYRRVRRSGSRLAFSREPLFTA